jgi:hypothetical protein
MADTLHLINKMPPSYSIFHSARPPREDSFAPITPSRRRLGGAFRLIFPAAFMLLLMFAPTVRAETDSSSSSLPDAPQPQVDKSGRRIPQTSTGRDNTVFTVHVGPAYPALADKWDTIIDPGESAQHLSATDKLLYAGHEQLEPVIFAPALTSALWGQLTDANPHYGVDAGGFGERFGSAMLRQATDRLTGDGLFAAALHQDPRYYREGDGSYVHRGLLAVRQTFLRRNDDGDEQVNASGILGHAASNYLAMTYYPHVSATVGVATAGFGTSIAADMGSKLILEFGPDLLYQIFRRNR